MDGRRFDNFTTRLAEQSLTRRGVVRSGIALIGMWVSARHPLTAQAQDECGIWDGVCDDTSPCCDELGLSCCDGICVAAGSDAHHCGSCGNVCGPEAPLCCNGQCIAPDAENCGFCGGVCAPCWTCDTSQGQGTCVFTCDEGELCGNGTCVTTCPPETVWCGGNSCVDLLTNTYHCGECDYTCGDFGVTGDPVGSVCINGSCQCPEGREACTGDTEDYCANLSSDPEQCGSCGTVCSDLYRGAICVGGTCQCPAETAPCGNLCCPTGAACENGTCSCQGDDCACPPGTVQCDGRCVDIWSDPGNCGSCGITCADNETCFLGGCSCTDWCWPHGCLDLLNDPLHCGACEAACAEGEQCVAGVCVSPGAGEKPDGEHHPSKPTVPASPAGSNHEVTAVSHLPSTGVGLAPASETDGFLFRLAGGAASAGLVAWLRRRTSTNDASGDLSQQ